MRVHKTQTAFIDFGLIVKKKKSNKVYTVHKKTLKNSLLTNKNMLN